MRREPTWASPNRVVIGPRTSRGCGTSPGVSDPVVPTLLFPPQAGHSSCIVDYSGEQSQVKTARAAGLTRLYGWTGWGHGPGQNTPIVDYMRSSRPRSSTSAGRSTSSGTARAAGWRPIYAALHPETRAHADDRGGAGRLPRRRRGDQRVRAEPAQPGRDAPSTRRSCGSAAAYFQGRVHAQRLHHDRARERDRQASAAAQHTSDDDGARRPAIARSRTGSSTRRTSRATSTCGSSSACSATTRSIRGELEIDGGRVDLAASAAREPARRRDETTSRRPRRCSRWPAPSRRPREEIVRRVTAAATSACSWAARRCATTGRRSSPPSTTRSRRAPSPAAARGGPRRHARRPGQTIPAPQSEPAHRMPRLCVIVSHTRLPLAGRLLIC